MREIIKTDKGDGVQRLMTTRELAERISVTPETIRRWVRAGRLRPHGRTLSGQLRFHPAQVREILGEPEMTPRARFIAARLNQAQLRGSIERMKRARRQL